MIIIILTTISYVFGVFFSIQGLRGPLDKPQIYYTISPFVLNFVFGWAPFLYALYITFITYGFRGAIILVVIRFLILTTLFNGLIKKSMERLGI